VASIGRRCRAADESANAATATTAIKGIRMRRIMSRDLCNTPCPIEMIDRRGVIKIRAVHIRTSRRGDAMADVAAVQNAFSSAGRGGSR
jgi:flavoprotein